MANLLPCPFCGKPTEYVCENDHHGDYFRLGCTDEDCPAHWTYYTEPQENAEECIRRWNTRAAQPPAAPVETDDLVKRLRTKHVYGAFEIEQQRQDAANEIERLTADYNEMRAAHDKLVSRSSAETSEPAVWVIPGDDNARPNGSIDAMAWREGEFTKPLYSHPPLQSAETARASAWLVEWPADDNVPVRWWNPATGWMRDANKAMWFVRESDAKDYVTASRAWGTNVKVTEHVFIGQNHLPAVPQAVQVTPAMIESAARAVGYRDYIRGMHKAPKKAEDWSRQHYTMYMGIAETALRAAFLNCRGLPDEGRRCANCHCPTFHEEALVNGQFWCHPCADAASTLSRPQSK